jgi:hypothetical protein
MLHIYAEAVAAMKAKNSGDPKSWIFSGSPTAYRIEPRSEAGATEGRCNRGGVSPGTPTQKALALATWGTCQAHYTGHPDYFLPWHRMYVFFFETIVRNVTGHLEFTLPYWDYSTPGPDHGIIPPQFRNSTDALWKILYVGKRNASDPNVNGGESIDLKDPNALDLDVLKKCDYSNIGSVTGFCSTLDGGLHGNVHVDIGDPQNMGSVPWAAGDPIFWLHHCNIDRLWASWNRRWAAGIRRDRRYLNQEFTFGDGDGNSVKAKIRDFLDIGALNYTYDRFRARRCLPTRDLENEPVTLAVARITLAAAPVRTPLRTVVWSRQQNECANLTTGSQISASIWS